MNYRIGLDIGIASIGWCVLETDINGEPSRIEDLGVRIFDKAETTDGDSPASSRRQARGLRRIVRRRAHRIERVKSLLQYAFGEEIVDEIEKNEPIDIIKLRVDGLDHKLTETEVGRLCIYFVKHRGFRSSRKAGAKEKDEGKLLIATKANRERLTRGNYRSVGELIYKEYSSVVNGKTVYAYRNKEDQYDNTFLREDLQDEISKILFCQKENGAISEDFINKYLSIFSSQRSFDEGPGNGSPYSGTFAVGLCTFERAKGYERAPKATYTYEYSTALQKLNSLIIYDDGTKISLSQEQRESVIAEIKKSKEISFAKLRKILGYEKNDNVRFNLLTYSKNKSIADVEKAKFVSMAKSYEIRKALSSDRLFDAEMVDSVAEIISKAKSLEKQRYLLKKTGYGFSDEEIENIGKIDATKFGHLSLFALKKIQPYLESGDVYSEACLKAGYNHSDFSGEKRKVLKGDDINEIINEIGSPVVRRSFSQTLKVLNAIILKYGSPIGVNVEVARELSKTFDERNKIKKANEERQNKNEKIKAYLYNEFGINAKGIDIIKWRLYDQQFGKCAYSGKPLDVARLFESNYVQVDHIIPYSRCFDDSFQNKVLVLTEENQAKRNMIPYEYFGKDEARWKQFVALVDTFEFSYRKKQLLLRKHFDPRDEAEWKERNLNDTKYVSRLVYNVIRNNLLFASCEKDKKKVRAVSGGITSYVRKMWGLTKIREDGDKHHALDAAVIATVTDKLEYNVTKYNQAKERLFSRLPDGNFIDADGVIVTREVYDELYGIRLAPPYRDFPAELDIRLSSESEEEDAYGNVRYGIREVYLQKLLGFGYTEEQIQKVKPVFVSRMPKRKAKGALHKGTIYSNKYNNEEEGNVIVLKTDIKKLKLKNGEIDGYFKMAKKSDPLLYEALKARLVEYGGDAEKAFDLPFHKPKSDGTLGPVVKKVKIEEKGSIGFDLPEKKGYANNEKRVRTDVFYKDGKYWCVPVYAKDIARGVIPNHAIVANKKYAKWEEMSDENFIFSLYKNDLIFVKADKPFNLTKKVSKDSEKTLLQMQEGFLYYEGIDISTGRIDISLHDRSYEGRLGVKTIPIMKKYTVDVLGNISEVKKEKREVLGIKKKKGE